MHLNTETEFADLDFSSAFQFCFYASFNLKVSDPSAFFFGGLHKEEMTDSRTDASVTLERKFQSLLRKMSN